MQNFILFLQYEANFQALVTCPCKIFKKLRKDSLRTQKNKKKISLQTPAIKKKKIRKLEPQPEQRFLIKITKCMVSLVQAVDWTIRFL